VIYLYWWASTFSEGEGQTVFENKVQMRIIGPKGSGVTVG
jgi:hypothetical protein